MREVVKLPAFANHPNLVEMCLDDAAETSPLPFEELLKKVSRAGANNCGTGSSSAIRLLDQMNPEAVEKLESKLAAPIHLKTSAGGFKKRPSRINFGR